MKDNEYGTRAQDDLSLGCRKGSQESFGNFLSLTALPTGLLLGDPSSASLAQKAVLERMLWGSGGHFFKQLLELMAVGGATGTHQLLPPVLTPLGKAELKHWPLG